jgi:hypothetical protein
MPRYFFHMNDVVDTEGQVFADAEEARREAREVARELAKDRSVSEGARLVVADESGAVVHEEPLEPFHEESES